MSKKDRSFLTEEGQRLLDTGLKHYAAANAANAARRQRYNVSVKLTRLIPGQAANIHWMKIGVAFALPDGRINLILETLPVMDSHWDGSLVLYPAEDDSNER